MLVTSIFSFSHNVFYPPIGSFPFLIYFYFVVCKCFEFGPVQKIVVFITFLLCNSIYIAGSDDQRWRESIRQQMEAELDQRVRDALESPPPPRHPRQLSADSCKKLTSSHHELEHLNAHVLLDLSDKERAYLKSRRWKALQAKRQMQRYMGMNYASPQNSSRIEVMFRDELSKSNQDEFPGVFGLTSFSEGVKDLNELHRKPFEKYATLRQLNKQYYTKEGFLNAARIGRFPDGTILDKASDGSYEDRFGVIRNQFGPFWPNDWGPLYPAPKFLWDTKPPVEPLYYFFKSKYSFYFCF